MESGKGKWISNVGDGRCPNPLPVRILRAEPSVVWMDASLPYDRKEILLV